MKKAAAPTYLTSAFNWDDMQYFLELARRGRLAVVARHFGVEHTTVSRRIAELEAALDQKLFDRSGSGHTRTAIADARLRPVLHGQIEIRRNFWLTTHEHSRKRPKILALMDFIRHEIEVDSDFLQGKAS